MVSQSFGTEEITFSESNQTNCATVLNRKCLSSISQAKINKCAWVTKLYYGTN